MLAVARALKHLNHVTVGEESWDMQVQRGGRSRIDAALAPLVANARARGGGAVVLLMGTHYNDAQRPAFRRDVRAAECNPSARLAQPAPRRCVRRSSVALRRRRPCRAHAGAERWPMALA